MTGLVRMGVFAAGGVLLACVLAACGAHRSHQAPTNSPRPVSSTPPAAPLSAQRASAISSALAAGKLREALAIPAGQALDPSAAGKLVALTPIRFEQATFHQLDAIHATVNGTVAHPPAGLGSRWLFRLVYVGGLWKLTDAEPAQ